jgi:hypothetical protein
MISILPILIPPPVDPAQAPKNDKNIKKNGRNDGHELKSVVVNPVVVNIDTS